MQSRPFGFLFTGLPSPQTAKTDAIGTIIQPSKLCKRCPMWSFYDNFIESRISNFPWRESTYSGSNCFSPCCTIRSRTRRSQEDEFSGLFLPLKDVHWLVSNAGADCGMPEVDIVARKKILSGEEDRQECRRSTSGIHRQRLPNSLNKKASHRGLQRRSPEQLYPEISYYILVGQALHSAQAVPANGHL